MLDFHSTLYRALNSNCFRLVFEIFLQVNKFWFLLTGSLFSLKKLLICLATLLSLSRTSAGDKLWFAYSGFSEVSSLDSQNLLTAAGNEIVASETSVVSSIFSWHFSQNPHFIHLYLVSLGQISWFIWFLHLSSSVLPNHG